MKMIALEESFWYDKLAAEGSNTTAAELRRAIELGLHRALANDHTLGHYLDEPQYAPFWETLQDLDVPLYTTPTPSRPTTGRSCRDTRGWIPRCGAGPRGPAGMRCG